MARVVAAQGAFERDQIEPVGQSMPMRPRGVAESLHLPGVGFVHHPEQPGAGVVQGLRATARLVASDSAALWSSEASRGRKAMR